MNPKLRSTITAVVLILLAAGLFACATTPPTQEMSDARQSVQAATEVGAEELAPRNITVAREYLEQAERELELRFFNRARHDALIAKSEAIKAHKVSVAVRDAREAVTQSSLSGEELAEAQSLLNQAEQAAMEGKDRAAIRLADDARRVVADGSGQ